MARLNPIYRHDIASLLPRKTLNKTRYVSYAFNSAVQNACPDQLPREHFSSLRLEIYKESDSRPWEIKKNGYVRKEAAAGITKCGTWVETEMWCVYQTAQETCPEINDAAFDEISIGEWQLRQFDSSRKQLSISLNPAILAALAPGFNFYVVCRKMTAFPFTERFSAIFDGIPARIHTKSLCFTIQESELDRVLKAIAEGMAVSSDGGVEFQIEYSLNAADVDKIVKRLASRWPSNKALENCEVFH